MNLVRCTLSSMMLLYLLPFSSAFLNQGRYLSMPTSCFLSRSQLRESGRISESHNLKRHIRLKDQRHGRYSFLITSMTATSNDQSVTTGKTGRSRSSNSHFPMNHCSVIDAHGKINRELAQQLYVWELDKRKRKDLEPLDFSMVTGLRWVHQAALKQLSGRHPTETTADSRSPSKFEVSMYSDLAQEGLSALLQAMSSYDPRIQEETWESFALKRIESAMSKALEEEEHLIRVPEAVRNVVKEAREVYRALRDRAGGMRPVTLDMVAKCLNLPLRELQNYLEWYDRYMNSRSSSVIPLEDTVAVSHPMLDESDRRYMDIEQWQSEQGYKSLLHDENTRRKGDSDTEYNSALDVLQYLDDYRDTDGDDDAWIREHEQVAGFLQDIIPDLEHEDDDYQEQSIYDDVLEHVIRENLGSFLQNNLNEKELTVIQMTFGLEGRQPSSFRQMASELKLQDKGEAVQILERALDKLRTLFRKKYLEPQGDLDDEMETESF